MDYATKGTSDAREGEDYVATSGTLTFEAGETSKTITVQILDDDTYEESAQVFYIDLENPSGVALPGSPRARVGIRSDDQEPTVSMENVTVSESAGTMTLTFRLSHLSDHLIEYFTNDSVVSGTATVIDDYNDFIPGTSRYIEIPARRLTKNFDITVVDDDVEDDDETIVIRWHKDSASKATPSYLDFTGTITDPPKCDNFENTIVVKNLTGEITQAGERQFHRIRLDPYRSYLIEAIGQVGEDMLGVEEHPNLTLSNPDIPAIWNAKATSRWITYGNSNDGDESKNVIRRFLRTGYLTYKVEVASGTNGTGTYQLKIRVNNICRINDEGNTQYQWAGGPEGYPADSDLPAGTGGRQVLLAGTDRGNNYVTRPELHHVLGDNWDSNPDEDWFGVDLEQGKEYTVRLRTKTNLPERLQATELKVLGIYDSNGNAISGTASAGAAGKKVFVTDREVPSTGRFYIAVGSEGTDRTGTYWLSITKKATN